MTRGMVIGKGMKKSLTEMCGAAKADIVPVLGGRGEGLFGWYICIFVCFIFKRKDILYACMYAFIHSVIISGGRDVCSTRDFFS